MGSVVKTIKKSPSAWCSFDGTSDAAVAGTYTRSGTLVTITMANHGILVNGLVNITFLTGGALNGSYVVNSVIDANTFTVITAASGTIATSNMQFNIHPILEGEGVKYVMNLATGVFAVNFVNAMPSIYYAKIGTVQNTSGNTAGCYMEEANTFTSTAAQAAMATSLTNSVQNRTPTDMTFNYCAFFAA